MGFPKYSWKIFPAYGFSTNSNVWRSLVKSIFLKKVLAKTVSHRNLQKLPQLINAKERVSFCEFLCETVLASTFLRKMDFSLQNFRVEELKSKHVDQQVRRWTKISKSPSNSKFVCLLHEKKGQNLSYRRFCGNSTCRIWPCPYTKRLELEWGGTQTLSRDFCQKFPKNHQDFFPSKGSSLSHVDMAGRRGSPNIHITKGCFI